MSLMFWALLAVIVYAYVGYPMILWAAAAVFKRPIQKSEERLPKVSILLSVFNEEKIIAKKIENLLSLDYPKESLEILIGSDGASDNTDEIVSQFASERVRFFRFVKNQGKPGIINSLVKEAKGTILVFTDVRQEFDVKAIRALVANFNDPAVGCVSGELYFRQSQSAMASGMGAYWAYEKFLRKKESELGSMLGATGAIYAIRKKLFTEVPVNMLVDDMYIPLSIVRQGFRAVFESGAKAYDDPSCAGGQEFKRKSRTLAGNYQIFFTFSDLLNPFKSPVGWQMLSHKFLRLMIPFFLIGLFAVNILLAAHPFYLGFFLGQVLFYGMAAVEAMGHGEKKTGIAYLPYTFCVLNVSALAGLIRFLRGNVSAAWEKAYK